MTALSDDPRFPSIVERYGSDAALVMKSLTILEGRQLNSPRGTLKQLIKLKDDGDKPTSVIRLRDGWEAHLHQTPIGPLMAVANVGDNNNADEIPVGDWNVFWDGRLTDSTRSITALPPYLSAFELDLIAIELGAITAPVTRSRSFGGFMNTRLAAAPTAASMTPEQQSIVSALVIQLGAVHVAAAERLAYKGELAGANLDAFEWLKRYWSHGLGNYMNVGVMDDSSFELADSMPVSEVDVASAAVEGENRSSIKLNGCSHCVRYLEQVLTPGRVDWRPEETIAEDYYALGAKKKKVEPMVAWSEALSRLVAQHWMALEYNRAIDSSYREGKNSVAMDELVRLATFHGMDKSSIDDDARELFYGVLSIYPEDLAPSWIDDEYDFKSARKFFGAADKGAGEAELDSENADIFSKPCPHCVAVIKKLPPLTGRVDWRPEETIAEDYYALGKKRQEKFGAAKDVPICESARELFKVLGKVEVKVHTNRNMKPPVYFSILVKDKVVAYSRGVDLKDVTFNVREGSRKSAVKAGQRNVHAFAVGTLVADAGKCATEVVEVNYNPFLGPCFYRSEHSDVEDCIFEAKAMKGFEWKIHVCED